MATYPWWNQKYGNVMDNFTFFSNLSLYWRSIYIPDQRGIVSSLYPCSIIKYCWYSASVDVTVTSRAQ